MLAALLLPVGAGQVVLGYLGRGVLLGAAALLVQLSWRWTGLWSFVFAAVLWAVSLFGVIRARTVGRALLPSRRVLLALLGFAVTFNVLGRATRLSLIKSWKVPSASMAPTLLPGDRFLSERWRPEPRVQLLETLLPRAPLARGDVVVFQPPDRTSPFVMRIVGLAGDVLAVRDGVLHINGTPISQRAVGNCELPGEDVRGESCELREEQLDARRYRVTRVPEEQGSRFPQERCPPAMESAPDGCKVPEGHLFVLGDNRANSYDSRYFGAIPWASVQARAFQLYWSRARDGQVRWERIGGAVD